MRRWIAGAALALGGTLACGGDDGPSSPSNQADLQVSVTAPATGLVGATLTYVVDTRNAGPRAASTIALTLTLPAGVTVQDPFGGTVTGSEVQWSVASLARNATRKDSVRVRIDQAGALSATVHGSATTEDPIPGNNDGSAASATASTTAGISADLATILRNVPASAATGASATLAIVTRNLGPSPAGNVALTLRLSPGTTITTASDGGTIADSVVTWPAVATIAAGDSVRYSVTITFPPIGPVRARLLATAGTADPVVSNNDGTATASSGSTLIGFVPVRTILGENAGDQFGWLAVNAGDLTGDGVNDLVFSAPTNDAGGTDAGRVYAYSGATGAALWTVTGTVPNAQLGFGVDAVGDVDGDGVPDIAAGRPGAGGGAVVVISGASGTVLATVPIGAAGDLTGYSVGPGGDLTGDGVPDILAGAPGRDLPGLPDGGRVLIISGATLTAAAEVLGVVSQGTFGGAVHTVGDLDNDGVPEFAVGASTAPGGGRVYVFNGSTGDTVFASVAGGAGAVNLGQYWVHSPGDLNADGVPDVYAADISADNGAGKAIVISGADGSVIRTFHGEAPQEQFGMGRGAGDVDGDGVPDLVLAAWLSGAGGNQAGKGYVYSGATGALLRSFASTSAGESLGFDVIAVGDVTGDGLVDFVLTAGQLNGAGKAYVIAGVPLP